MFEVPASRASVKQNQFEFKIPGDRKTYSIPKLQFLRPALLRQMDSMKNQVDRVYALIENYHPGLVDKFDDMEQLTALYTAWSEGSGITVGESSASSTS
jgi:hypothetical protein